MPEPYKDSYGISMGLETVQVTSRSAVRQLTFAVNQDHVDGHSPNPSVASVQHAAVSDAISNTGALWFLSLVNVTASSGHGAPLSDQSNAMHRIASNNSQPYSTSICLHDTINRSDTEPLGFPILPNANPSTLANGNLTYNNCGRERTARTIHHPSLSKQDLFEMSASETGFQLNWVELPQDHFEGSSIGAVISLPRNESNTTQDIIVCNLSAAWGPSELSVQTVDGGLSAVSSKRGVDSKDLYKPASIKLTHTPTSQGQTIGGTWANYELSSIPMQQVVIHESWAKYLNPLIEDFNTTLINLLLRRDVYDCLAVPVYAAQMSLAGLIVNGMSRIGEGSRLQGDVRAVGPLGRWAQRRWRSRRRLLAFGKRERIQRQPRGERQLDQVSCGIHARRVCLQHTDHASETRDCRACRILRLGPGPRHLRCHHRYALSPPSLPPP